MPLRRAQSETKAKVADDPSQPRSTLRFYGDAFVFDTRSGMFFRLNPSASLVLRSLDQGVRPEELPKLLEEYYHIDHATATRDIELLLNEFAGLEPLDRIVHDKQSVS